jgi:hypothetical protein
VSQRQYARGVNVQLQKLAQSRKQRWASTDFLSALYVSARRLVSQFQQDKGIRSRSVAYLRFLSLAIGLWVMVVEWRWQYYINATRRQKVTDGTSCTPLICSAMRESSGPPQHQKPIPAVIQPLLAHTTQWHYSPVPYEKPSSNLDHQYALRPSAQA